MAITDPAERLSDPAQEARARALSQQIRCVVCQNQSIDDSNADIARDMRTLVREHITKGESDEQILAYLHERYGDFILLSPPLRLGTMVLWFGPLALLATGALLMRPYFKGKRKRP